MIVDGKACIPDHLMTDPPPGPKLVAPRHLTQPQEAHIRRLCRQRNVPQDIIDLIETRIPGMSQYYASEWIDHLYDYMYRPGTDWSQTP